MTTPFTELNDQERTDYLAKLTGFIDGLLAKSPEERMGKKTVFETHYAYTAGHLTGDLQDKINELNRFYNPSQVKKTPPPVPPPPADKVKPVTPPADKVKLVTPPVGKVAAMRAKILEGQQVKANTPEKPASVPGKVKAPPGLAEMLAGKPKKPGEKPTPSAEGKTTVGKLKQDEAPQGLAALFAGGPRPGPPSKYLRDPNAPSPKAGESPNASASEEAPRPPRPLNPFGGGGNPFAGVKLKTVEPGAHKPISKPLGEKSIAKLMAEDAMRLVQERQARLAKLPGADAKQKQPQDEPKKARTELEQKLAQQRMKQKLKAQKENQNPEADHDKGPSKT